MSFDIMNMMRMNKKGLEFKKGFFALVSFSLIIIAIGVIVGGWNTNYNSGLTNDLDSFNKLDEASSSVNVQSTRLTPNDPDPGTDAEANTFRGVYGILTNTFSNYDPVLGDDSIIDEASNRFGIPGFVKQAVITLIIASLVFSLIGVIFRLGKPA